MTYNAEIRGFAAYYALAGDVKKKLDKLSLIWGTSLGRTLANKHNRSVTQIFNRLRCGRDKVLRYEVKGRARYVKVWRLSAFAPRVVAQPDIDDAPETAIFTKPKRSILGRVSSDRCDRCRVKNLVCEQHEVRYLSWLSGLSAASLMPANKTQKRVFVCQPCLNDLRQMGSQRPMMPVI